MVVASNHWHVGLVGYGEVGRILAEDLRKDGVQVSAYDIKLGGEQEKPLRDHAAGIGVALASSHADLAAQCRLHRFRGYGEPGGAGGPGLCAGLSGNGAWFLDFNSASPGAKRRAAALIDGAGGRYVEGAVMTSVPPYRIAVPMLLGGPGALRPGAKLLALGFAARVAIADLGVASAVKMCRSIMIKGLEAMMIGVLTTARVYGVEDAVLASLAEDLPGVHWDQQAAYFFRRVIEHGRRRAEEMREVAATVREIGLTPGRRWHRRASGLGRRSRGRRFVRPERHQGICSQSRLAHRSRPDPRWAQAQGMRNMKMKSPEHPIS